MASKYNEVPRTQGPGVPPYLRQFAEKTGEVTSYSSSSISTSSTSTSSSSVSESSSSVSSESSTSE